MRSDPRDPQVCFDLAEQDLTWASKRLAEGGFPDCAHHPQQCAEKALKVRLIGRGRQLQKTHNLAFLLKAAEPHGLDFGWFADAADTLTAEYVADRYPRFDDAPLAPDELRELLAQAVRLFEGLAGRKYTGPTLPK